MTRNYEQFIKMKPCFGEGVYIAPNATVIGAVTLGRDVSVWPGAVVRGDMHAIRIGDRSNVQDNSVLHITHAGDFNAEGFPLEIGQDVTIGHGVILHGCTVHDRVLVGMGTMIMDGAVVESDVLLAAGSLVSPGKHLQAGFLYRGRPAVKIRELTDQEHKLLTYGPENYIALKNAYLAVS